MNKYVYKVFFIKALFKSIFLLQNNEIIILIKAEKRIKNYPSIIDTNIRGGGGREKGSNSSSNNNNDDAMRISTARRKGQWGWYNDNEESNRKNKRNSSSYNRGKDLYSSMLQKGTTKTFTTTSKQPNSYRSNYDYDNGDGDDDDSFYDIPSSYLFMSENEEEEKIIRALSIPPLVHDEDDDDLNKDSDEIIYDYDDNDVYSGYDDDDDDHEQMLTSQSRISSRDKIRTTTATIFTETRIDDGSPKSKQNATTLNDNNSTTSNFYEKKYNITTSTSTSTSTKNIISKPVATSKNNLHREENHDDGDIHSSENSRNRNLFNMKDTIKQIRTSNNFIHHNMNKATMGDDVESTNLDDVKKRQSSISSSSTQDPYATLKQNQRRNFIPNFQKRIKKGTNTNTNLNNLPIEIPQSIDDIRSRAAAKSSSKYNNRSNGFHLNFQPNHQGQQIQQQQQQQQQQEREGHVQRNQRVQRRNEFIQNIIPQRSQHTKATQHSTVTSQTSQEQKQHQGPTTSATTTVRKTVNRNKAATTMSLTTPWARKFILSRPKDSLLPIPREFLTDGFNLVQLAPIVESIVGDNEERINHGQYQDNHIGSASTITSSSPTYPSLYKAALRLILEENDSNDSSISQFNSTKPLSSTSSHGQPVSNKKSFHSQAQIQKAAEILYTLVHARYVSSPRGLDTIRRMFLRNYELGTNQVFGKCPRVTCNGTPLLPFGYSDHYDIHDNGGIERKSMRYCCCCGEAFYLWESKVDGSAWGPSFCHLFIMTYGKELFACLNNTPIKLKATTKVDRNHQHEDHRPTPQIFGFHIHPLANVQYPKL